MVEHNDKCPVCGNEEGFYITSMGSEWACLISNLIGEVKLTACTECGCVYVGLRYRKQYEKSKAERKSNG
jgi:uncharacterized Zn finger protein